MPNAMVVPCNSSYNDILGYGMYICPDVSQGYSTQQTLFHSTKRPLYFFPYANSKTEWYVEIVGMYRILLPQLTTTPPQPFQYAIQTWCNMHQNQQGKPLPSAVLLFQLGEITLLSTSLTTQSRVLQQARLARIQNVHHANYVEDLLI